MNAANANKVTNIFVLMLENHSFDHIFAMSGIPGIRAATLADHNDQGGKSYAVINGAPPSMSTDPGHEFLDVMEQLCGKEAAALYDFGCSRGSTDFDECRDCAYPPITGKGFASNYAASTSEGTGRPAADRVGDIMACFDTPRQLPVIDQLAREFAICDAWHASLPGPTWPNRFFVHGASSAGMDDSPDLKQEVEWMSVHGFEYANGSIYEALDKAGHGWRLYQDKHNDYSDQPSSPVQGGWISQVASLKGISLRDVHSLRHFESDLGALNADKTPAYTQYPYTFIEPNFGASFFSTQIDTHGNKQPGPRYKGGSSQHPEDNPYGGEALIKHVYETIRASPVWETSLLIIVYDEHGGFYDSIIPPSAIPPGDAIPKGQESLNKHCFDFSRYGVRVPAVIVSPFIPKATVDHTLYDHSSVLATLERKLSLAALTARDRGAADLWHLLSETAPRSDCPVTLRNPAPIPHAENAETDDFDDLPLPKSGNLIGFLHILGKAEHEGGRLAKDIVAELGSMKTHKDARDYVARLWSKLTDI